MEWRTSAKLGLPRSAARLEGCDAHPARTMPEAKRHPRMRMTSVGSIRSDFASCDRNPGPRHEARSAKRSGIARGRAPALVAKLVTAWARSGLVGLD
jgi:hypothetical protein